MSFSFATAQQLHDVCAQCNTEGQFVVTVLTDNEGLPLASAQQGANMMSESLSAMVPIIQQQVERTNTRLGLAMPQEVLVRNSDGMRLISRFFKAGDRTLILVCLVPPHLSYRRVMNKTVTAMKRLWRGDTSSSPVRAG